MLRPDEKYRQKNLSCFATFAHAAASAASAANGRTIGAHRKVHRTEMTATLFAVGLATIGACDAIHRNRPGIFIRGIDRASGKIFVDDGLHERASAHCANLEQANLFAGQPHLRYRIVNNHAELGVIANLKSIDVHNDYRNYRLGGVRGGAILR